MPISSRNDLKYLLFLALTSQPDLSRQEDVVLHLVSVENLVACFVIGAGIMPRVTYPFPALSHVRQERGLSKFGVKSWQSQLQAAVFAICMFSRVDKIDIRNTCSFYDK